ncbi:c-type cytochrome [Terrimonas ferruginea]|uniref:c-type cytochrome n=1 Tax=Terrimonas ferruginea TaxID=249 RepID=UPI00048E9A7E|nr:cytochrome c [Terrimonas ferruginea]
MKKLLILSLLLTALTLCYCTAQKAVEYDIPDHVGQQTRTALIERAEKGKVLYRIHCSNCHGIFTKGKDSIPNFTGIQIDNYHTTALIGIDPRNHAVAKKMSPEQIDYIVTFLRVRKVKK